MKDKSYINADIKKLDRLKKREYRKHGRSEKYLKLKKKFEEKLKKAATDHLEKNVRSLKESDPGRAYATLKKMGAQPGDMLDDGSFVLLNHLEEKLTNKEAVERISSHFAKISQQYPPLDTQSLPQHVQDKLAEGAHLFGRGPQIEEYEVYDKLMKAKKPKTGIPGDLPRCLVKEFSPELSVPLAKIYNQIISTGVWPEPWRVEHGIPLQKKTNPENEDDLRIISLTSFYSKVFKNLSWIGC